MSKVAEKVGGNHLELELEKELHLQQNPAEKVKETTTPRQWIKYAALAFVVIHQTAAVFTMRYSQAARKAAGRPPYLSTVTVFTTEVTKFVGCFMVVTIQEGSVAKSLRITLSLGESWAELMRLAIPALLYSVQNNLLFLALANLTAAIYTVSYQLKTLTTALFSVWILGKELSRIQWIALAFLSVGVALLQLPSDISRSSDKSPSSTEPPPSTFNRGSFAVGMLAVVSASLTSGFCGVFMEKLLKQANVGLWERNLQLALVSAPVSFVGALLCDYSRIQKGGLLQGYDALVWSVVCINALGGLAIAVVLRYADNIVKCFATALAVLASCVLSAFMGELTLSSIFIAGSSLVACASVLYGLGAGTALQDFLACVSSVSACNFKAAVILASFMTLLLVLIKLVGTESELALHAANYNLPLHITNRALR